MLYSNWKCLTQFKYVKKKNQNKRTKNYNFVFYYCKLNDLVSDVISVLVLWK